STRRITRSTQEGGNFGAKRRPNSLRVYLIGASRRESVFASSADPPRPLRSKRPLSRTDGAAIIGALLYDVQHDRDRRPSAVAAGSPGNAVRRPQRGAAP